MESLLQVQPEFFVLVIKVKIQLIRIAILADLVISNFNQICFKEISKI